MAFMHFYAQLNEIKLGPWVMAIPDDMDEDDRLDFTAEFRKLEFEPAKFMNLFRGMDFIMDEAGAIHRIQELIEEFLNKRYPEPQYKPVASFHSDTFETKDYYLPALKVFNTRDGEFYSPARTVHWKNLELRAEHIEIGEMSRLSNRYDTYKYKGDKRHKVNEVCDCGIYGSVNTEELNIYLHAQGDQAPIMLDHTFDPMQRALCIIEPANRASVFVARKGWKTSKAFISEVVNETISIAQASTLLSMVWNRKVDVAKVYENLRYQV